MIDTHTHIFCKEFDNDVLEVIKRANEVGVDKMVLPAIDSESYDALFHLCEKFPETLFPTIGLHPTSVASHWQEQIMVVEKYLKERRGDVVAIGEVGLDLYWSREFEQQQKEAFRAQIEMSLSSDLPLVIHTREAYKEMQEVLNDYKDSGIRGIFHSFDQSLEMFKEMSKYESFFFGVGGVVTFKKSVIAQTIKDIPLERLVLETDAPYLTPAPYRGKRNEPTYLKYIVEKIAEIKGEDVEIVKDIVTRNSKTVFGI